MIQLVSRFFPKLGNVTLSEVTEEDIKQLIEMGQKEGTILEEEKRMIHSIFKFTAPFLKFFSRRQPFTALSSSLDNP